jgi:hypothetical protein
LQIEELGHCFWTYLPRIKKRYEPVLEAYTEKIYQAALCHKKEEIFVELAKILPAEVINTIMAITDRKGLTVAGWLKHFNPTLKKDQLPKTYK